VSKLFADEPIQRIVSTPTYYVLFALSNLHITPGIRRDLGYAANLRRKSDRFFVALAFDHHGPGHPRDLVGERDGNRRHPAV